MCCREPGAAHQLFRQSSTTAVVAGKPERWVCCARLNLSGGDSSISGEVWQARVKGNPSSPPHMAGYASAWGEVGGKQEAGVGWVRQQQQQQSWAARRAWPSSSCLPSYLLCLSRLPPPLGPTAISVVPRLPGPQSYLTHAVNHPPLLSDHLKDPTQAFDSQVKPA